MNVHAMHIELCRAHSLDQLSFFNELTNPLRRGGIFVAIALINVRPASASSVRKLSRRGQAWKAVLFMISCFCLSDALVAVNFYLPTYTVTLRDFKGR